jgi:AmiR/NasT family two-component response regulator
MTPVMAGEVPVSQGNDVTSRDRGAETSVWARPSEVVSEDVEVNRLIGAGTGVLLLGHVLSYRQAASTLREASGERRRSLVDLAREIITGTAFPDRSRRSDRGSS